MTKKEINTNTLVLTRSFESTRCIFETEKNGVSYRFEVGSMGIPEMIVLHTQDQKTGEQDLNEVASARTKKEFVDAVYSYFN